jgi:hypothetical protein
MHDIEPYHRWQDKYESVKDKNSPFYGRVYNEFAYTQKIYNYFIHPFWDNFGSSTLYMKILYADYENGYAIFEMLGEWNDCLHNDVMYLKRDVVDELMPYGINKFVIIAENVLNFHAGDDDYYEEWYDDVKDEGGWVCLINLLPHVEEEMEEVKLKFYLNYGGPFNDINWRAFTPQSLLFKVENTLVKRLG